MARRNNTQHSMQGVFIFVLLGLFALMSTLMVLLGAQMYRSTVEHSEYNNSSRILGAYVRSMVRSMDRADAVKVEDLDGVKALSFQETYDDEVYVTWIYQYEGKLYEQFTDLTDDFSPARGTEICPANSFTPSISGGLLTLNMTDGADVPCNVQVALRCA